MRFNLQAKAAALAAARAKAIAAARIKYIQDVKAAALAAAIARVTYPTPVNAPIQYGGGAIQGQARIRLVQMFVRASASCEYLGKLPA